MLGSSFTEPLQGGQIGSTARARARRDAERRLLGLLCSDPALASVAVPISGAGTLPLSEAIAPEEFTDQGHSAIFAAIRNAAEEARVLNFDGLLGELADPLLKKLASDLYLFGMEVFRNASALSGGSGQVNVGHIGGRHSGESAQGNTNSFGDRTVSDEVVVSWCDLENLERRERFRNSGERGDDSPPRTLDPNGAVERLARLRERGHDVTAVSTFFSRRSSPASDSGRSKTT